MPAFVPLYMPYIPCYLGFPPFVYRCAFESIQAVNSLFGGELVECRQARARHQGRGLTSAKRSVNTEVEQPVAASRGGGTAPPPEAVAAAPRHTGVGAPDRGKTWAELCSCPDALVEKSWKLPELESVVHASTLTANCLRLPIMNDRLKNWAGPGVK